MKKMLIAYYSAVNGNTRRIAQQLQAATGADMEAIETLEPYTGSHQAIVDQGRREVDAGFKPAIRLLRHDLDGYDAIAVGTSTWWYTMAPAVRTFLTGHSLAGKTVVLFQTHGGWPGHTLRDMKALCKGAGFICPMQVQFDSAGGAELVTPQAEIDAWIKAVRADVVDGKPSL